MNGMPETWTLVPGAWLHTASRAVGRPNTGRGSCGNGWPCGASIQWRQARIAASTLSSSADRATLIDRASSVIGDDITRAIDLSDVQQHGLPHMGKQHAFCPEPLVIGVDGQIIEVDGQFEVVLETFRDEQIGATAPPRIAPRPSRYRR